MSGRWRQPRVDVSKTRKISDIWRGRQLYLMMVPGLLFLFVYRYLPMYGVVIAFKDFRVARGILKSPWAGLVNFEELFLSPFFEMILRNTIIISGLKLIFVFPVPIILALMLNEVAGLRLKKTIQTVLYLPHFLSWVVIGNLIFILIAPSTGVLSNFMQTVAGSQIDMLIHPDKFRVLLVISEIWKEAGWGTIIFLAALVGVDPNLYEASLMDGAKKLQQIWYITIPAIMPVIIIIFILRLGYVMDAGFEQIFVLQNVMVYEKSEIIDTYVYKAGFEQGRYALGAAAGLFKSVIGMALVLIANRLTKTAGSEAMW